MTIPDDPFVDLPDLPPGPYDSTILAGATVVEITRHPIYGVTYRCNCWSARYPWRVARGAVVNVYRGDTRDAPHVAEVVVDRVRRSGAGFKEVAVGFDGGEVIVDLTFEGDQEVSVGDTLSFDRA